VTSVGPAQLHVEAPAVPTEVTPGRSADRTERSAAAERGAAPNTLAGVLVIAAASWYLLGQLAVVVRPLFMAAFLCCLLLPYHSYLRRKLPSLASVAVLAGAAAGILFLLALLIYANAAQLREETPNLVRHGHEMIARGQELWAEHVPSWLAGTGTREVVPRAEEVERLKHILGVVLNGAVALFAEAFMVGIYLVVLLLTAEHLGDRVRGAFPPARADAILHVSGTITASLASYLKVTIQVSLLLAVLATVILWLFGVKFALLWGVVTFIANFVPYVGSIVACGLPLAFAFLQLDPGWQPVLLAVVLIALHVVVAYAINPAMMGRAVDLSPLVVLIALAVWGQCWGVIGMVLAVPLTVLLKIVLENLPATRPLGRLLAEQ
jgi:AI-2 transport protein TqsA